MGISCPSWDLMVRAEVVGLMADSLIYKEKSCRGAIIAFSLVNNLGGTFLATERERGI